MRADGFEAVLHAW